MKSQEKGFLFYYTLIWITAGGVLNLVDFLTIGDSVALIAFLITVPSVYWLLNNLLRK